MGKSAGLAIWLKNLEIQTRCSRDVDKALSAFRCLSTTTEDAEIVLTGAIVVYARCFAEVRGRYTYPLKLIKDARGFDREIHDHLLELRRKMLAHVDGDVLKTNVTLFTSKVTVGALEQTVTLGLTTWDHGFVAYKNQTFVDRILSHLASTSTAIRDQWVIAARRYLNALSEYDRSRATLVAGPSVSSRTSTSAVIEIKAALHDLIDDIPNLSFSAEYQLGSVARSISRAHIVIHDENGNEATIDVKESTLIFQDESGAILGEERGKNCVGPMLGMSGAGNKKES